MRLYLAVFIDLYSRMVSETRKEKEVEVFDYLERFHNKPRKHSAIGLCSPEQFENGETNNCKAAAYANNRSR
jgi:transposase InsO family protein